MTSINAILHTIETLDARARTERSPALGLEAAALAEGLASEHAEGRYANLARGLELRLRYAPGAADTLAAFERAVAAVEAGPHATVGQLKIARRAIAGALQEHESALPPAARKWLETTDFIPLPEDLTRAR